LNSDSKDPFCGLMKLLFRMTACKAPDKK